MAALNPRSAKMYFPNEIAGFINFGKNLHRIDPKSAPSFINLFICALLNFISVDILFSTFSLSLFICVCVKNNSWSKSALLIFFCLFLMLFHCYFLLLLLFYFIFFAVKRS